MIRKLYHQKTEELRPLFENLAGLSQSMPSNWLGQLASHMLRRTVVTFAPLPLDIKVGNLQLSCHLKDSDAERQFTFMPELFENKERKLLSWFLPNKGVFVDIGADVGIYTLSAACNLSSGGRIVAVEQDPTSFDRLSTNVCKNAQYSSDWPVIDLIQTAVVDNAQTSIEQIKTVNHLQAPASESIANSGVTTSKTNVEKVSLQMLIDHTELTRIDVLKIDTSGDEESVLMSFFDSAPLALFPKTIFLKSTVIGSKSELPIVLKELGYFRVFKSKTNVVYRLRLN